MGFRIGSQSFARHQDNQLSASWPFSPSTEDSIQKTIGRHQQKDTLLPSHQGYPVCLMSDLPKPLASTSLLRLPGASGTGHLCRGLSCERKRGRLVFRLWWTLNKQLEEKGSFLRSCHVNSDRRPQLCPIPLFPSHFAIQNAKNCQSQLIAHPRCSESRRSHSIPAVVRDPDNPEAARWVKDHKGLG